MSPQKAAARRAAAAAEDPVGARERILTSSIRLFQQSGYEGTSVSRIAAAAGMTPANIYWHFPSKLDLLAESLRALYESSYPALAAAASSGSAEVRLENYARAYVRMQLTELDENCNFGYASLASSLSTEKQRELLQSGRPYLVLVREILEQGRREGVFATAEPTVTAFAISTMCEYVFTWFRAEGALTVDEVGREYAGLALRMARG
ncbi:TetR/AcrR family transcriptional regulator [Aeromicrobium sp. 50.2.37]|uniref:TetR/AcrR family transcriptional regulator n=1 Tax=Aeromicrobium sp. 50.2.37 TaxID=2969305 RepID=UPI00214F6ABB|nr:TetR/AcrR family transcriptional regulator [Aeromicrobium sp. 50.2.37]MCR4512646.1 TetR/AcrR family transcriptional regulator [Aeromicrobium sp. 50.2.37]